MVQNGTGSVPKQDSSMQDATSASAAAAVGATTSSGSSPSHLTSQPNGLHADHLSNGSHSGNGTQEASHAAAADSQQDSHMQGTSLPPANGFVAGIASAMATALPSNAVNGGGHRGNADAELSPGGSTEPKDTGCSVQEGPIADAGAADASAAANQLSEDGQSTSETNGLKRMPWMEANGGGAAAEWQVVDQADGQPNGKGPVQPNGKALSQEDGTGAAFPWLTPCNVTITAQFLIAQHAHSLSTLHVLQHTYMTSVTPTRAQESMSPAAGQQGSSSVSMRLDSCVCMCAHLGVSLQSGKTSQEIRRLGHSGNRRPGHPHLKCLPWTPSMSVLLPAPSLLLSGCHPAFTSSLPCYHLALASSLLCLLCSPSTCLLSSRYAQGHHQAAAVPVVAVINISHLSC